MIQSILFPDLANIGDTVDGKSFSWIKETDGQWTKIINSTAFAQSVITVIKNDLSLSSIISGDIFQISTIKQNATLAPNTVFSDVINVINVKEIHSQSLITADFLTINYI